MQDERVKITNLLSDKGNKVANQYNLETPEANYFKSYNVIIAKINKTTGELFILPNALNFSRTTNKWFNVWLRKYGRVNNLTDLTKDKQDELHTKII